MTHEITTSGVRRSSGSFELLGGAAVFALIGHLIDRALDTTPWFLLAGATVGFIAASSAIYYQYTDRMTSENEARARMADR